MALADEIDNSALVLALEREDPSRPVLELLITGDTINHSNAMGEYPSASEYYMQNIRCSYCVTRSWS